MKKFINGKGVIIFIISMFAFLTIILVAALVFVTNTETLPIHARTFVKEKNTGLVTVTDGKGRIICTFYDSVGGIGCRCPDTAYVYPNTK